MGCIKDVWYALQLYWPTLFLILYPLVLLPVFLINDIPSNRCIYVIALMVGYYIAEVLPLAIISMIPIALLPLMGIMSSVTTSMCYLSATTVSFVGGYMLSLAIETSRLHQRMTLYLMKLFGYTPRRLHIGFVFLTMFLSMWISNTVVTIVMLPTLKKSLRELEAQGAVRIYTSKITTVEKEQYLDKLHRPSHGTMGLFISIAYAASIGGTGFLTGSATNHEFREFYEFKYDGKDSIKWLLISLPWMIITTCFMIFWVEVLYMGLFRPKSKDSEKFVFTAEQRQGVKEYVNEKIGELEPIHFHEIAVAVCTVLGIILWIFRKPLLYDGWADLWNPYNTKIKDATVGVLLVLLIFLLPKLPDFIYLFSKDEDKKPTTRSPGLLGWKVAVKEIPWSILYVIGAGFALKEGAIACRLSDKLQDEMNNLQYYTEFEAVAISALVAAGITQLTPNVAACAFLMPILSNVAQLADVRAEHIMLISCIACSFGYLLPIATPPIALVVELTKMRIWELLKVGIVVWIASYIILIALAAAIFPLIFVDDALPDSTRLENAPIIHNVHGS